MTDSIDPFVLSLEREVPPLGATSMLRAVWHGLRGDWDAAHELAQAQDDSEGAWVHAWLHRVEGASATPTTGIDARAGHHAVTTRGTRGSRSPGR